MGFVLSDTEIRVLGCLLEKEMATPEYYPLTLNGLTNACNQKSNRQPVVSYDEATVVRALDDLKEKQLVRQSNVSRVPKYEQVFTENNKLINREAAVLGVLLLRGPQTVGEIRGRTERLCRFEDLTEVVETLGGLADLDYVVKLARQPGRKESRYSHLLAGEPAEAAAGRDAEPEAATLQVRAENERLAACEAELQKLRQEMSDMQQAFEKFAAQFE